MTSRYTLPLANTQATLENVGGKGASLSRLVNAGLPVPDGFHVTTEAYQQFVADNALQDSILEAVKGVALSQPSTLDTASQTIEELFARSPMPPEIAGEIARAYAGLTGTEPVVAVRSSATAEDLPGLSFAGQQDTYLNIHGTEAVEDAVKRCWASLWTARAIGYRAQHGIDQETVRLAVVVQLLVPAEAAGIMFTANPVNGSRDQAMITATWGLGEAIVGGMVTPDTLTVEKSTGRVIERETSDKQLMTVRTESGTEERPTPETLRHAPVLGDPEAAELARLGNRIEQLYGTPMDIEWAVSDGRVAIVQARPITALPPAPAAELEWKLPKPKGSYARASIIELLPQPLTPLFGTLGAAEINQGYDRLSDLLGMSGGSSGFPSPFLILINDYAYYDTTFTPGQILRFLLVAPRIYPRLLSTAERRWKDEVRPRYAECVARWKSRDLRALSAHELTEGVRDVVSQAIDHYIYGIQAGVLPAAYTSESMFALFYDKFIKRAGDPPSLTFMLGYDSLPIRAEKSLYDLGQWCGEHPTLAEFISSSTSAQLETQLSDHADLPEGVQTDDWKEFQARFAAHMEKYGHAIYDLDFAKALPADHPTPILETLKHLVQGQGSNPYLRQQESSARREESVRRIDARLGRIRRYWFRRLLRWAQRLAPIREDALGDVGLGWPLVRQMLLELGRRLAEAGAISSPEDVFWLTESELDTLVEELDRGNTRLANKALTVEARKSRIEAESRHTPLPALPPKFKFAGMDMTRWLPARTEQVAGNTIKGIGASPGQVTATARVLRGPEDFGQMKNGDVLVAAITTPAWTPLFALASAVVTDVGGPLSHSSIVAREYGIPAVLGTGVATNRIHSGDTVVVDGSAGTVTLPTDGVSSRQLSSRASS